MGITSIKARLLEELGFVKYVPAEFRVAPILRGKTKRRSKSCVGTPSGHPDQNKSRSINVCSSDDQSTAGLPMLTTCTHTNTYNRILVGSSLLCRPIVVLSGEFFSSHDSCWVPMCTSNSLWGIFLTQTHITSLWGTSKTEYGRFRPHGVPLAIFSLWGPQFVPHKELVTHCYCYNLHSTPQVPWNESPRTHPHTYHTDPIS